MGGAAVLSEKFGQAVPLSGGPYGLLLVEHHLIDNHNDQNRRADQIREGTRIDHTQTGGNTHQPKHHVQLAQHEADEARAQQEHAAGGGNDNPHHVKDRVLADEEHDGAEHEDVGDDKGRDGQTGGVQTGLHGVGLGDGGAGIGGQGHRRRNVSHDAEVEHEEVSRHQGHAHLDQDGGAGGGHDHVVGRGGHAHAQNNTAQHSQHQRDNQLVARHCHNGVDDNLAQTGGGYHAGHNARHAAGHAHGQAALGAALQSGNVGLHILPVGLADQGKDNEQHEEDGQEPGGHQIPVGIQLLGSGVGEDRRQIGHAEGVNQQGNTGNQHEQLASHALLPVHHAGHDGHQGGDHRTVGHGKGAGLHDGIHQHHQGEQQVELGPDVPEFRQLKIGRAHV